MLNGTVFLGTFQVHSNHPKSRSRSRRKSQNALYMIKSGQEVDSKEMEEADSATVIS